MYDNNTIDGFGILLVRFVLSQISMENHPILSTGKKFTWWTWFYTKLENYKTQKILRFFILKWSQLLSFDGGVVHKNSVINKHNPTDQFQYIKILTWFWGLGE